MTLPKKNKNDSSTVEICILAGGGSSRMGQDKAVLLLGRRTMLGIIRAEAEKVGVRVRTIRRDKVEACGPLGGIFTGLESARADAVLFLACDMPLVNARFIGKVLARFSGQPLFVQSESPGFPFVLPRDALPIVEKQIAVRQLSIQKLCNKLEGLVLEPTRAEALLLYNVNTPEDLAGLREKLRISPASLH